MDVNYSQDRTDFRCGLCRQKGAFHCEHDTPYRDQYLASYDSNTPRTSVGSNNRRSKSETRTSTITNHSVNNGGVRTQRQVHTNAAAPAGTGARYEQNKYSNKTYVDDQHVNYSTKTNEQNKKSKSCVIL